MIKVLKVMMVLGLKTSKTKTSAKS